MGYYGDRVRGKVCPKGHPIFYNGNYFCSEFQRGEDCWVMDPDAPDDDIIQAYLAQRDRE